MAKIDYENGGRISGRIGDRVYSGDTVRVRPRRRRADEWTPAQKLQRLRYKAVVDLYKMLKNVLINPVWRYSADKGLTAFNLFISKNLQAFDTKGKIKDPLMLKMAIGKLPQPFGMKAELNPADPTTVNITWQNDEVLDTSRSKDHMIAVYYSGTEFRPPITTEFQRKAQSATLQLPEGFGQGTYVYIFFGSEDMDAFSESWVSLV